MYEMCLNRNHRSNFKWFATSNSFLVFSFFLNGSFQAVLLT